MTGSPFTTTSGGGTPTGSGVRGRSARRTRASAGSGRGVTGAAASTGSSWRYDRRFHIADRLEKRNGRPPRERVIQDVEMPIERTASSSSTGSWPTCRSSRSGCARSCVCATTTGGRYTRSDRARDLRQRRLLVVGAGRRRSTERRDQRTDRAPGQRTRRTQVAVLRRVLLPEEFRRALWRRDYRAVKNDYDPDSRLLDLYEKAVQRR